jgi:hypothetical protein
VEGGSSFVTLKTAVLKSHLQQMFENSFIPALTIESGSTKLPPSLGCLGSSMVEQLTLNQLVSGSSPDRGTTSTFIAEQVDDTYSGSNEYHQPEQAPYGHFQHRKF